ncbi:DUF5702 domain-containing protein [Agathobacter sp.]
MRGSITIFATMLLMMISQFLFTVLEAGRNIELTNIAKMNSEAVVESVFAQYCRPLWDEYHLLTYDAGTDAAGNVNINEIDTYMRNVTTENFKISTDDTIAFGTSMLRLSMDEIDPLKYALITDDNGGVYAREIVSYMKENLGYEIASNLYSEYQAMNETASDSVYDDNGIDNALGTLNSANKAKPSAARCSLNSKTSSTAAKKTDTVTENPLVEVQKVKATGILSQVVDEGSVSGNRINTGERVSSRALHKGNIESAGMDDWYAKILMQQYFLSYMSNYLSPDNSHAMNYEVEYIIGGKSTDKDNLKTVVTEILVIREALNMAYLISSPTKQAEAASLATGLAGWTANPAIVDAVKWGLLFGWAYCESVLDVRALLDGDKIPMIKSDSSWTSGISGMGRLLSGNTKAKSSDAGIGYKAYLGVLLFTKSTSTMAYRAMDVQEATVRMVEGYGNFRMDNCICEINADVTYKYHGLFLCFVNLLNGADNEFLIRNKAQYSYYGE